MADYLKVLDQVAAPATTATVLYTVPNLTSTTTSTLVVCNRSSATVTFRVSIRKAAAAENDKQYIFYDNPLNPHSTLAAVIGMTLAEKDVVYVYASATGLSFNLFGVETV